MRKTVLLCLIMMLSCLILQGQKVSNVRAQYYSEAGYYEIKYDFKGKVDGSYFIRVTGISDQNIHRQLNAVSGEGIDSEVKPGKNLSLLWQPVAEGLPKEGWKFSLEAIPQKVSNVRSQYYSAEGYYEIKYDLNGNANDLYFIKVLGTLDKTIQRELKAVSGEGINSCIKPGKDYSLSWQPQTDGLTKGDWIFSLEAIPQNYVLVEGGTFMMGRSYNSHEVTVSSFWIDKYQVTQREWQEVMGSNPSQFKDDNLPVEYVSWYDVIEYCNKRSIKEGLTPCYSGSRDNIICNWNADGYRLPTEAEWEYAARGGNRSRGYEYAGSNKKKTVAWFKSNSKRKTHPVGQKSPNELGLYDMSGNVDEWCWDWYDRSYYGKSPKRDPRGAASGDKRVLRGGSWRDEVVFCEVNYSYYGSPSDSYSTRGFRVVRSVKGDDSVTISQDIDEIESSFALDLGINDPQSQLSVKEEEEQKVVSSAMVFVEGGTFMMGTNVVNDEKPIHEVILSSFWIGNYQVTQKEWQSVMGSNPSRHKGDNLPVVNVSWYDAVEYCNERSIKEGLTPCYSGSGNNINCDWSADGYRLPTEAEWEYAARGGNKSRGYEYAGSNTLGNVAWHNDNSGNKPNPVGQKSSNELGLYDMSGNVYEWCWDRYHKSYYSKSPKRDPRGAKKGKERVQRGGFYGTSSFGCRVSNRSSDPPTKQYGLGGFRVSRAIK